MFKRSTNQFLPTNNLNPESKGQKKVKSAWLVEKRVFKKLQGN